jgi:general secretion pathway protein G
MLARFHQQRELRKARRSAFTLLEVLVVVAIIVMLAGVGSYYVYQRYEESKISKAKIDTKKLAGFVEEYKLKNDGAPPASIQDLAKGDSPLASQEELMDPWSKPYNLDANGAKPRVFTTSPKGQVIDNLTK